MSRRANASYGMDRQADVPEFRECWTAVMDPGADPNLEIVRPGSFAERTLDSHALW